MKEDVKLFLEIADDEMLAQDETIDEFYHTLTEVCGDYGFEWEKTNKTNHMWSAHETKHFDIILTKVND